MGRDLSYDLLAARLMAAADRLSRCGRSTGDFHAAVEARNEMDAVAMDLRDAREKAAAPATTKPDADAPRPWGSFDGEGLP